MIKVKILGAGSIGNHLAHACRKKGWEVIICDVDPKALKRTKNDIYPSRYGQWDEKIRLSTLDDIPNENYDLIIIGTPPDTHMHLAIEIIKAEQPPVLLIEKPLATPSLYRCQELYENASLSKTVVCAGYNHTLTENTQEAEQLISAGLFGTPLTISASFREHWGGIFSAHPWLQGPKDSYLGYYSRGGGACGEHSHAINIWQHFAHLLGKGKVTEVSAFMDIVSAPPVEYDQLALLNVKTEAGFAGNIIQDVITRPHQKMLRLQGETGFLEWHVNWDKGHDAIRYGAGSGSINDNLIPKTRPDDFLGEINEIEKVLGGEQSNLPISLERGLDTMMVIAAAYKSAAEKKTVFIDYSKGYSDEALKTA